MKRLTNLLLLTSAALLIGLGSGSADSLEWPRQIDSRDTTIIVYQPQLESFTNDILTARAAVSVQGANDAEPSFGAVWFEAQAETDREQRNVTLRNVKVLQSKFPETNEKKAARFEELFNRGVSGWNLDMSLDQMLTMLDEKKRSGIEVRDIKNDPPEILFRTHPALLVLVDGEPKLQSVPGSKIMRVINSPMYIVFEPSLKSFYLRIGDEWFASAKMKGQWRSISQPPTSVLDVAAKEDFPPVPPEVQGNLDKKPEIIVSYQPAELIVSNDEPQYALIEGTGLLYLSNSDSDLFLEVDSQKYYVTLSGRWFSSRALRGPWQYVPAEKLPADFARIPEGSPKEHVLAHVVDTVQAREAILDATIPQTAKVERDRTIDITYDGTPEFVPISGTSMAYVVNSPYAVLRVDGRYYACDEAVWFVAASPYGPWRVAITIPAEIYSLPPSIPIYYVRYVYVYGYTPDIVYVGYTPGYLGTYVYGGTIVYGTGYHYRPWYRTYYYPRPLTWGFHVNYNTYYGWTFGVGLNGYYGNLWYSFGWGWWGPVHHHHHYYNDVYINMDRQIVVKRPGNIYRPIDKKTWQEQWRVREREKLEYRTEKKNRVEQTERSRDQKTWGAIERQKVRKPESRPEAEKVRRNDVYTDKKGNIYRRTESGWQKREKGDWKPDQQLKQKENGQSREKSLNRELKARERGYERSKKLERPEPGFVFGDRDDGRRPLTFPDKKGRKTKD